MITDPVRSKLRRIAGGVVVLAALGVVPVTPSTGATPAATTPVLGDYDAAVLGPPGADKVRTVDIPATIAALQRAKVNTYAYLIYGDGAANAYCTGQPTGCDRTAISHLVSQAQWNQLPAFADAAQAAGIDILVYLVPPSESFRGDKSVPVPDRRSTYAPFYWDYTRWATEIAQLRVAHPNITGIVMDDFGGNTVEGGSRYTFTFSVAYVNTMMNSARAISPGVTFHAVLYYQQYWGMNSIAGAYRRVADGYVFPYNWSQGPPEVGNTWDASRARAHGLLTASMTTCWQGDGCLQLGVPARTTTQAGWYGSVEQTVAVDPAESYRLSFRVSDTWIGAQPFGHHQVQVLVDGQVAWSQDVVNYRDWQAVTVDLTSRLRDKTSARLTLRVYEQAGVANFPVQVWIDDLRPTGFRIANPGFESSLTGWTRLESRALFDESWVPDLSYLYMPYASRLASDGTDPAYRTSAEYVRTVTTIALDQTRAGRADGTLVYCLNLTGTDDGRGDPLALDAIADLYGNY